MLREQSVTYSARESSTEDRGQKLLEAEGWEVVKVGHKGLPDRQILFGGGLHAWWEAKKDADSPLTPLQERRIPKLRRLGELVIVSHDPELVVRTLRAWVAQHPGLSPADRSFMTARRVRAQSDDILDPKES